MLTIKQKQAILLMSQPQYSAISLERIAQSIGINVRTLFRWRSNPEFRATLLKAYNDTFFHVRKRMDYVLFEAALDGDLKALKLFYHIENMLWKRAFPKGFFFSEEPLLSEAVKTGDLAPPTMVPPEELSEGVREKRPKVRPKVSSEPSPMSDVSDMGTKEKLPKKQSIHPIRRFFMAGGAQEKQEKSDISGHEPPPDNLAKKIKEGRSAGHWATQYSGLPEA